MSSTKPMKRLINYNQFRYLFFESQFSLPPCLTYRRPDIQLSLFQNQKQNDYHLYGKCSIKSNIQYYLMKFVLANLSILKLNWIP